MAIERICIKCHKRIKEGSKRKIYCQCEKPSQYSGDYASYVIISQDSSTYYKPKQVSVKTRIIQFTPTINIKREELA